MRPDVSDEHLVTQAQSGQKEAFLTLYNRYLNKVYNRVKSRVPMHDAEDVTQEIFIAVVHSLERFEGRSSFSTWLYTIVNRQIADYYRQHYRKKRDKTISIDQHDHIDIAVEDDFMEERVVLQRMLQEIPENYQEIILMRFADGLTFAEIADKQGKSLEATKSLYRRAIQTLTKRVGRT